MRRLTVGLLVLAALLLQGCLCILVCPETFGDMRLQADDLDLPDDFTLVTEESGGSRSTFAAAHAPEVSREYAAPWEDGKLCDRIRSLAGSSSLWPAKEESFRREYGGCGFDTRIAAGWRAWPVNNWSYKLFVAVTPPDWRSRPPRRSASRFGRSTRSSRSPDGPVHISAIPDGAGFPPVTRSWTSPSAQAKAGSRLRCRASRALHQEPCRDGLVGGGDSPPRTRLRRGKIPC